MYKQREIFLVPFPFSDLTSFKRRPALLLSTNNHNSKFADILACVVTGNHFKDDYSVDLENTDLTAGILPEKSVIKCHKLFTMQQSLIIKRFSMISEEKFKEVEYALYKLIQTSM